MFKLIYKWTDKIKEKVAVLSKKLNEKGQGMTEYALILAAVAAIAVLAIWGTNGGAGLNKAITDAFGNATSKVTEANTKTQ